jgi:hypothetical protein
MHYLWNNHRLLNGVGQGCSMLQRNVFVDDERSIALDPQRDFVESNHKVIAKQRTVEVRAGRALANDNRVSAVSLGGRPQVLLDRCHRPDP